MVESSKKEGFKFLIQEFHSQPLPETCPRELSVSLKTKKVVTVYGPRRSGKSYFLYTLIKQLTAEGVSNDRILYLNFEDDRILPLKVEDLGSLLEAYFELYPENKNSEKYFFFDEIQNVPDWEIFVRRIHDKENVRIFLTGSSSKLLSREIATSLRGRTISFALYPLSFREILRFKGIPAERNVEYGPDRFRIKKLLDEYLEHGGFPEIVLEENNLIRNKILEEYFESLVLRDLAERHHAENMPLLRDLLKHLFANSACLFSVNAYYKAVRQVLPASRRGITDYLRYIQETGYIQLLPKFSYSLKEQRVNPQKIICLDLGVRNRVVFRFSPDTGKAAENVVGGSLTRRMDSVFYWKGKREVDFVFQESSGLCGINVTYGSSVHDRELEGLLELKKEMKNVRKLLLVTKDTEGKSGEVEMVPLWKWLLRD